jgi:DNA polymerase-3 subunit epsilon
MMTKKKKMMMMTPSSAFSHKTAAIWAYWLQDRGISVLDTETTGLHSEAEVIEIALVHSWGSTLLNVPIKPFVPLDSNAMDFHKIRNRDLKNYPEFHEVYYELRNQIEGSVIGIYNADFDVRAINHSAKVWGLPPIEFKAVCLMHLAAAYFGNWSDYHQSYTWVKLVDAAKRFDIPIEGHHTALGDARMALNILRGMAGLEPVKFPSRK